MTSSRRLRDHPPPLDVQLDQAEANLAALRHAADDGQVRPHELAPAELVVQVLRARLGA